MPRRMRRRKKRRKRSLRRTLQACQVSDMFMLSSIVLSVG